VPNTRLGTRRRGWSIRTQRGEPKLKHCPFCGVGPEAIRLLPQADGSITAGCEICGATIKVFSRYRGGTIAAWNNRHEPEKGGPPP